MSDAELTVDGLIAEGRRQQDGRENAVRMLIAEAVGEIRAALGSLGDELLKTPEITDTKWRLYNSANPEIERLVITISHSSLHSPLYVIYLTEENQTAKILLASNTDADGPNLDNLTSVSIANRLGDAKTLFRVCDLLANNAHDTDDEETEVG